MSDVSPASRPGPAATVGRHLLLGIFAVAALVPLLFVLLTALKSGRDYQLDPTGFPSHPTLDNLVRAVRDLPLVRWLVNTVAVAAVSVTGAIVVAALGAYGLVFGRFPGRRLLLQVNIGAIMVPPIVLLLPVFVLMVNAGLINTLPAVMIFYLCLMVPFSVFFLTNFFSAIPYDVIEAATIDGAGPLRTLRQVVLPMSGAAMATLAVVNVVWVWNELLIALVFLQSESNRTLIVGVTLIQGRYVTNQPLVLAVTLVSLLPIVVFYLFGQRYFVQGLTAGMGK